jgi:hypothetical protein
MSVAPTDHSDDVAPAHDPAAEAAHARHHAVENNWFFLAFFSLVGLAVLCYEFTGNNWWSIFLLGAARFALIAVFIFSLIRPFSFVVAALAFTILFFGGMVYFSMWGSTLSKVGDPIIISSESPHH